MFVSKKMQQKKVKNVLLLQERQVSTNHQYHCKVYPRNLHHSSCLSRLVRPQRLFLSSKMSFRGLGSTVRPIRNFPSVRPGPRPTVHWWDCCKLSRSFWWAEKSDSWVRCSISVIGCSRLPPECLKKPVKIRLNHVKQNSNKTHESEKHFSWANSW